MGENSTLNKLELIGRLPQVDYDPEAATRDESLDQMSLTKSLLQLAGLDQDQQYVLCLSAAQWLLEEVPEPDDSDLDFDELEQDEASPDHDEV